MWISRSAFPRRTSGKHDLTPISSQSTIRDAIGYALKLRNVAVKVSLLFTISVTILALSDTLFASLHELAIELFIKQDQLKVYLF